MQNHAFIGRQPILDSQQQIVAYELLFRHDADATHAVIEDDLKACAQVLVNAMSVMGTHWLLGDKLAFVNVSEDLLHSEFLELLPPRQTVLEVLETVSPSPDVLHRLQELHAQGFQIALDDFVATPETLGFLPYAQYIKLDVRALGLQQTEQMTRQLHAWPVKIIAEKVESHEEYEACRQLGFDYFQGYYFEHPETLSARIINPSYTSVLELLNLASSHAELRTLENGFKRDPALSIKLLRYINSPGLPGADGEIHSIHQALTLLGSRQLLRWLTLLLATADETATAPALMKTALTRGRLTELLGAERLAPPDRDGLFVVGVFSLLDAMLEIPMQQALEKIQLPQAIRQALLDHGGIYGPFLQLAIACEGEDVDTISHLARTLRYDPDRINDCHMAALAWVENLGL